MVNDDHVLDKYASSFIFLSVKTYFYPYAFA